MNSVPKFPKPGQVKQPKLAVKVFRDGREVCDLSIKAGLDEYIRRKRVAWEDQKHICPICHLQLFWKDAMTDHIKPRKMGSGSRDDRQQNIQAVHAICNSLKSSKRNFVLDDLIP